MLTTDHPVGILGRALKSGTEYSPERPKSNNLDTPKFLGYPTPKQASNKTTQVVDSNLLSVSTCVTLERGELTIPP